MLGIARPALKMRKRSIAIEVEGDLGDPLWVAQGKRLDVTLIDGILVGLLVRADAVIQNCGFKFRVVVVGQPDDPPAFVFLGVKVHIKGIINFAVLNLLANRFNGLG